MEVNSFEPVRPAALRLAFAPDLASAREVSMAIRNFLAEQGVAEKELFSYELCIAEASNNAVEYAEGPSRNLRPVAEVLFTPSQIELRVTDHTAGFVLQDKIPQPEPLVDRGRGLFIIQSVMDEVRYLRGTRENILVMRKKRSAVPVPNAACKELSSEPLTLEKCQRLLAESSSQMAKMADELLLRSETLSSVFRYCAELGSVDKVSESFEGRLLIDLLHLTSADWYVLRMLSPDNKKLLVVAASEPDLARPPIDLPASSGIHAGIEAEVAASRTAARFDIRESSDPTEPLRAVGPSGAGLVCPLCFAGTLVGTIAVGRRNGDFPLGRLQDEVIRTFAEFLAIQTLNLGRLKEEVRNRVVARELEIAQNIQHLLLPRTLPQLPGFSLAGGWQSAREVGGDFYDAIALDGNRLLLMIADVMGKGVPAALFATTMRGLLRGLAMRSSDPSQLLSALNRLLYNELSSVGMFITAQIVLVDLKSRNLTAASAGHCPLLYVPLGRRTVATMPIEGLPLGVMPDTEYSQLTGRLGSQTALLLYTDGLTDTRNVAGKQYGSRRLKTWLKAHATPGLSATELADYLATELNHFRGDAAMDDDQAFLLLTEDGSGAARQAPTTARRIRQRCGSFLFPAIAGAPSLT
jgi:serine phosphatase RsbU (regulator of sigma subunit)/anti-sigma regulatory factor (Ser/Thr protein kinase)